jgi:hypothetical protein
VTAAVIDAATAHLTPKAFGRGRWIGMEKVNGRIVQKSDCDRYMYSILDCEKHPSVHYWTSRITLKIRVKVWAELH